MDSNLGGDDNRGDAGSRFSTGWWRKGTLDPPLTRGLQCAVQNPPCIPPFSKGESLDPDSRLKYETGRWGMTKGVPFDRRRVSGRGKPPLSPFTKGGEAEFPLTR
jgi:hypothetical protein